MNEEVGTEQVVDNFDFLDDFFEGTQQSTSLTGWHTATVTEYTDRKGNAYPSDVEGNNGNRTLRVAFEFDNGNPESPDTVLWFFNYRPDFLNPDTLASVPKQLNWSAATPDDKSIWFTRTGLAGLKKALAGQGRVLNITNGQIDTDTLFGLQLDVNLQPNTRKEGRIEVSSFNPFAASGARDKSGSDV